MKSGEVLEIGAGNIGRALIGQVMSAAGLHVTFADVNADLINSINQEGGYPVEVVSITGSQEAYVDNIDAISSLDESAMIGHIVDADMITTAVGVGILPRVAPILARGLMERYKKRPGDEMHVVVVACENMERNTETLRDHILAALPDDVWRQTILEAVSFPNAAVDRIVPNTKSSLDHTLAVITEDYFQLAIDASALKGPMPDIPGIELVDDLEAVLSQKLFTLNGGHAAAAYWGYMKGYGTISDAMADESIFGLVHGLMEEVGDVITRHYPSISAQQQAEFANKTIRRFTNPYLGDAPQRVGREPLRKLGQHDRLLRPALLSLADGDVPANISMAIVGGFRFDSPDDSQAVEIQHTIHEHGIHAAVISATGLHRTHPLVRQTVAGYQLAELSGA